MLFKPNSLPARVVELQRLAWAVACRTAPLPFSALVSRRERHLVWRLWDVCFGASRPGVYPEVPPSLFFHDQLSVRLLELRAEPFNVTEIELMVLAALASSLAGGTIFELGTADGRTTLNLAANVGTGHVYTLNIDLDQDTTHRQNVSIGARFCARPEAARISQLVGDSRSFDFKPYDRRCQLVFIDADHSESAVCADSQVALRLVDRRYGAIVWHDALRYGVQQALPQLMRQAELPVHLVSGTNLAILCFAADRAVTPARWTTCRLSLVS